MSVVVVVSGILLAAAAGAYYFFAVFSKDEKLRGARAQVETWEAGWRETRQCMLGEEPLADTFAHALLARELSLGSSREAIGDCTKLIGQLTRPSGNNTGIEAVEIAWQSVEKLAIEAAQAYVLHLRERRADSKLPAAMNALAAARVELRRQVKLSPDDGAMGPAPHPLVVRPLEVEGKALTELRLLPAVEGLLGFGKAGERGYVVRVRRGGAALQVEAKPALDVAPVLPELTWGAGAEGDGELEQVELLAGPLDGEGKVALETGKLVDRSTRLSVLAAVGAGPARAIVYFNADRTVVAVSKDGGARWRSQELAESQRQLTQVFAGEGYADVVWASVPLEETTLPHVSWVRVDAARLPAVPSGKEAVTISDAVPRDFCQAKVAPWALLRTSSQEEGTKKNFLVHLRDPQKQIALEWNLNDIISCNDEVALLVDSYARTLWRCTKAGECKQLPWRTSYVYAGIADGALLVTSRDQLAALLAPEGPPRFVQLPEGTSMEGVYSLDGVAHLMVKKPGGELLLGSLAAVPAAK
jgi:hypothetical protein